MKNKRMGLKVKKIKKMKGWKRKKWKYSQNKRRKKSLRNPPMTMLKKNLIQKSKNDTLINVLILCV
jgi:hypothetical protein